MHRQLELGSLFLSCVISVPVMEDIVSLVFARRSSFSPSANILFLLSSRRGLSEKICYTPYSGRASSTPLRFLNTR